MRTRTRATTALAAACAAALLMPAIAGAATVTVTGDDGNPVALNAAAATPLRHMDAEVSVALAGTDKGYAISIAGPVAPATSPRTCGLSSGQHNLDYQGNATYTVNVTTYTNTACTTGAKATAYQIAVGSSSPLTAPAGLLLTRKPNDFASITHLIPIALNPGALTHEIRYAKGGVIGPDGGISGASETATADSTTGAVPLLLVEPGAYVMVARPQGFTGAAGQFYAPWSPAISFRAIAPFDLATTPTFPDDRGPRYKLRGELREKSAKGKVRIQFAKGKRGKFFSVGKAKMRRGVFKKRFTLHRTGVYRVKFTFKGSGTVAPGTIVTRMQIRKRFF